MLAWEVWFGEAACEGLSSGAAVAFLAKGKRPPLLPEKRSDPKPPAPVVRFVASCWAHSPAARPTAADALEFCVAKVAPAVAAAPSQLQRLELALTGLSQASAEAPVVRLRAEQARLRVQQLEAGGG